MKLIYFTYFTFMILLSFGQGKKSYIKNVFIYDSTSQTRIIGLDYKYLQLQKKSIFKSGGGQLSINLNLAKFFTKKVLIGIYADIKIYTGSKQQNFSQSFINDFNNNFIINYSNDEDSTISHILKNAINKSDGAIMSGTDFLNYGIVVSPFPLKYGGMQLIISNGVRNFDFYGKNYIKEEKGSENLVLKNNYSIELSMKPYLFFRKGKLSKEVPQFYNLYKQITFSLYYERISLQGATVENLPLNNIVNENFISKYDNQKHFGFKVGLSLY